jgi:hypothetical protein
MGSCRLKPWWYKRASLLLEKSANCWLWALSQLCFTDRATGCPVSVWILRRFTSGVPVSKRRFTRTCKIPGVYRRLARWLPIVDKS